VSTQRLRITSVPMGPALVTGAWAGFVPGLFIGATLGALVSFGAGAALSWMRELTFTTGIEGQLLPFGNRIGLLQSLQDGWFLVIPAAALLMGAFSALIGVLTAAVVSASYGSLLHGIEVEAEVAAEPMPKAPESKRRRAHRRTDSAA
jgi:hypothetical protein